MNAKIQLPIHENKRKILFLKLDDYVIMRAGFFDPEPQSPMSDT
jgi:hypothetical protein